MTWKVLPIPENFLTIPENFRSSFLNFSVNFSMYITYIGGFVYFVYSVPVGIFTVHDGYPQWYISEQTGGASPFLTPLLFVYLFSCYICKGEKIAPPPNGFHIFLFPLMRQTTFFAMLKPRKKKCRNVGNNPTSNCLPDTEGKGTVSWDHIHF